MDLGPHDHRTFLARTGTVVMGRATHDGIDKESMPRTYQGKRTFVATSRPIPGPKGPLETRSDVDALIAELRALDDGDVWMLGGGQLQTAVMERAALDEIEIHVIPERLGGGALSFPGTGVRASPGLLGAQALDRGCARLHDALT